MVRGEIILLLLNSWYLSRQIVSSLLVIKNESHTLLFRACQRYETRGDRMVIHFSAQKIYQFASFKTTFMFLHALRALMTICQMPKYVERFERNF